MSPSSRQAIRFALDPPATASWMQVALGLSQPFVTEPWIRA